MQRLGMVFSISLIVLSGSILIAQSPGGPGRVKNACDADIQKYCAGIEHGQGRVLQCLKQNQASLEPGCKSQLERVRAHLQAGAVACHDDILKFCSDVPRGQGRIYQCLKKNEAELSAGCKQHLQKRRRGPT